MNHPDEPVPKYLAEFLSSLILQSRIILLVFPKFQVYNLFKGRMKISFQYAKFSRLLKLIQFVGCHMECQKARKSMICLLDLFKMFSRFKAV